MEGCRTRGALGVQTSAINGDCSLWKSEVDPLRTSASPVWPLKSGQLTYGRSRLRSISSKGLAPALDPGKLLDLGHRKNHQKCED